MKRKLCSVLLSAVLAVSMLAGCGSKDAAPAAETSTAPAKEEVAEAPAKEEVAEDTSAETYKVYLITMDQMDQHWVNVDTGCKEAVKDFPNVEYKWLAPDVKDDAKQIECINNAVADNANAILLAANGPDAVTAALEEAVAAGVKIIYVDSAADFEGEVTFATDNQAAGKTAGEEMLKAFTDKGVTSGKIGIVNVNAATASCVARETGFRSAFEGTDFELLETQYSEGDAAKSKDIAANYITSGCVGIFGANEGSTTGVGNAIQEAGDDVVGVGFDKSDTILSLIKNGYLLATMAQNPDVMGYEGLKAAVAVLGGESFGGKVTDTGVSVITKDGL
ncbi:substrate-binding domain-containing protein [Kineothrix sp. MB12-C1]|uniref:substrate-binding domain-containing protein n=1 Tax=Kineothrix sp. MB12-C1 TaxID=3070215 RepID=UPI0027D21B0C|nr:substrate-binding domain-containing protein [Kineothrix sp. MB12-C1]WMC94388.1 substrate-binding domain-containing protein [Kineothrix sp. MB12-C1]